MASALTLRAPVAQGITSQRRRAGVTRHGAQQGFSQRRLVRARDGVAPLKTEDADLVIVPWDCEGETWCEESKSRMHELLDRFKAADTDGNGVIDFHELRAMLEKVGDGMETVPVHWLTDDDIQAVIRQYDTNGDGVISWDEFVRMAQDNIFLTGKLSEYKAAFTAVDSGGNGTISATELFQLFERIEHPISYDKLVRIRDKYDVDQSGMIDFGEFLRMFRGELLDLQEVLSYIKTSGHAPETSSPASITKAPATLSGKVTSFFHERELDLILAANPSKLVVLEASLTWCRPCKKFQPSYEKFAESYPDTVFLKFYGNSNDTTKHLFKERLKCRSTPSFFFFREGQVVGSCTGANGGRLEYNLGLVLRQGETTPAEPLFPSYVPPEQ